MRTLVITLAIVLLLAFGALEMLAARGVPDAGVSGGATTESVPALADTFPSSW